jgi:hypothetical protein
MTRLLLVGIGVLVLVSTLSRTSVASATVKNERECDPSTDAGCFQVVICEYMLQCGGGGSLCAEVRENGQPMGTCYRAET